MKVQAPKVRMSTAFNVLWNVKGKTLFWIPYGENNRLFPLNLLGPKSLRANMDGWIYDIGGNLAGVERNTLEIKRWRGMGMCIGNMKIIFFHWRSFGGAWGRYSEICPKIGHFSEQKPPLTLLVNIFEIWDSICIVHKLLRKSTIKFFRWRSYKISP